MRPLLSNSPAGSKVLTHHRWVVRTDGPASCSYPQGVPRLPWCSTPPLGSVLHAHKLLHQFLAARPCPAGALRSASSVASAFCISLFKAAPSSRGGKGRLNFLYSRQWP